MQLLVDFNEFRRADKKDKDAKQGDPLLDAVARKMTAKIANQRKDQLHKLSRALVNASAAIFVGNVNASALARTRMAKSVLDVGWSAFRTMLQYKCDDAGAWFDEVNEAHSTQDCSVCHARSGPTGLKDLGIIRSGEASVLCSPVLLRRGFIREWTCTECDSHHDRDVNAARNILAAGHRRLAEGIPAL